jgi:hypothetical protein
MGVGGVELCGFGDFGNGEFFGFLSFVIGIDFSITIRTKLMRYKCFVGLN